MDQKTKIVCDTNIWYEIGNGYSTPPAADYLIVGTFLNTLEFSKTKNLIKNTEFTRNGIQALMTHAKGSMIHTPPLLHLKSLQDTNFEYHFTENHLSILKFLQRVANGAEIAADKFELFENESDVEKFKLIQVAKYLNSAAQEIKKTIRDKKEHRANNMVVQNRSLILQFVTESTNSLEKFEGFDWSKIELFEAALNQIFKEVETGASQFEANDFTDLFMLMYVQPGMLYWTHEKKWLSLIEAAGMGHYLYETP